jgi:hypothetical protein
MKLVIFLYFKFELVQTSYVHLGIPCLSILIHLFFALQIATMTLEYYVQI